MDPVVRSIQVAAALLERVAALMRGGSSGFGSTSVDDLELRLGEAQQTVPEIWNHLASARDALAAAGHDVAEFDRIRGGLRVALASTDISIEERYAWTGRSETVKTVRWDVEGFRRAAAACAALKRVRADVDWAGLDREQAREIAAAGSLTASRWRTLAIWGGIAALVVAIAAALR